MRRQNHTNNLLVTFPARVSSHFNLLLTSEDVSASTLHEGHESFVLDDLHAAVKGGFVENTGSGGHHHSTSDGIDGVGSEARDDGNS